MYISINYENFLIYLNILPDDLLYLIWKFIPVQSRIWFNKTLYYKSYIMYTKELLANNKLYTNYLRFLIRKDLHIPLNLNFKENFDIFKLNNKRYFYKNNKFQNFTEFLFYYSDENESNKCKQIIRKYYKINKQSSVGYRFKNKKIKENKWIN